MKFKYNKFVVYGKCLFYTCSVHKYSYSNGISIFNIRSDTYTHLNVRFIGYIINELSLNQKNKNIREIIDTNHHGIE